jgi:hypothetical protein
MPLGFVTKTRDLELGAQKQVGVLMKEHQTLLGFTTKTRGLKRGAKPLHRFTLFKKGPPLVKDDETIGREFLCWSFQNGCSSIC